MSLLRRIVDHFVEPPGQPAPAEPSVALARGRRPREEWPDDALAEPATSASRRDRRPEEAPGGAPDAYARDIPPGVAVLSAAADALPLGAALGLAVANRRRAPVVVCVWTAERAAGAGWRAPALLLGRRLAATLAARGHDARAAGRLVIVRLPAPPEEAAADARRAIAAAGAAPTVLALGGPRAGAFDALLAEQDLVVVATSSATDPALARLAIAGLSPGMVRACVCEVPLAHPTRSLATAGLLLLPSARRALAGPVEALS